MCLPIGKIMGGVYWRPIFNLLEDETRTILLVNPQQIKAVPGRKTDVKESEWLADLLRHGLIQPSFIPLAPGARAARTDASPQSARAATYPGGQSTGKGPGDLLCQSP